MSAWMRRGQPSHHSKEFQKVIKYAKKVRRSRMRIVRRWSYIKPFFGWWRRGEFRCSFCPLKRKECVATGCRSRTPDMPGYRDINKYRGSDNGKIWERNRKA